MVPLFLIIEGFSGFVFAQEAFHDQVCKAGVAVLSRCIPAGVPGVGTGRSSVGQS
jgi:hypothetical protein